MGTVITVMNMKGGVGKTTVAMHLGGMLARYPRVANGEKKVLLIDYDPQFNLSQAFIPPDKYYELEAQHKTVLSVLLDDQSDLNPYSLQTPDSESPPSVKTLTYSLFRGRDGRQLHIIASTLNLMYLAMGYTEKQLKPIEVRFGKFITECRGIYDFIFIDCHPAGSVFTKTSLRNSDHVLIPVIPQRYAVRGIGLMLQFIKAKKLGISGPEPHILFNYVRRSGISPEETEIRQNPRFGRRCMTNTLKKYKVFSEPMDGKGFVWTSTKPYSNQAFSNIYQVATELAKFK
jgi:chromosome partitioning protein